MEAIITAFLGGLFIGVWGTAVYLLRGWKKDLETQERNRNFFNASSKRLGGK